MIVLAVGLCFAIVGSIVTDMKTEYPEIDINDSLLEGYDYSEQIASNGTLLQTMIDMMDDDDKGYILKAVIGVAAIPVAFFGAITMLFSTMGIGISMLTNIAAEIGIPSFVIYFAVTALTITIVFGILSWWRRYRD